ncbi:hypothetical protein GQF04_13085 [Paenibacillus aceris]|uniref:Transposase IS204/IS1001/IS1096/IS1165 DDE domain-containing protein n=1 Tax=Paenibacillus aceris TaxID=869555 RepID=A0ABS4I870_9BACL|nr:hypothetical protein [Paenibacillus aceris]MBP1967124.1 hypothetical protein [Paenibacillus aceris]NHW35535.1 hypothetical protein [Paenibacillus aceris]
MQTQYINEHLNIPELHISQILFVDHDLPVTAARDSQRYQWDANRTPSVSLQEEILSARTGDSFVLYDLSCRIRMDLLIRGAQITLQQAPTSTVQRLHQEAVPQISEQMQAKAWAAAKTMTGLVLGVDDQVYHTWFSECFPAAIRIADRFHLQ